MSTDDRVPFGASERPVLMTLRRQPPAGGLAGLRRKLARLDAGTNSTVLFSRVFATRSSRAAFAVASALAVVALSVGLIHEYRHSQAGTNAAVARALDDQLQLVEHPLPAGVVGGEPGTADAFEVDTGNAEVRFYWMLADER